MHLALLPLSFPWWAFYFSPLYLPAFCNFANRTLSRRYIYIGTGWKQIRELYGIIYSSSTPQRPRVIKSRNRESGSEWLIVRRARQFLLLTGESQKCLPVPFSPSRSRYTGVHGNQRATTEIKLGVREGQISERRDLRDRGIRFAPFHPPRSGFIRARIA